MGKARNLANLLNADGDVKTDHLDNVPASNDASALTTGTLPAARLPSSGVDASSLTTGTLPAARLPGNKAENDLFAVRIRTSEATLPGENKLTKGVFKSQE